jgi:hypothetical protein
LKRIGVKEQRAESIDEDGGGRRVWVQREGCREIAER